MSRLSRWTAGHAGAIAIAQVADDAREYGYKDNEQDDDLDVIYDTGDVCGKEVSSQEHSPHPQDGADHVEENEAAELHSCHAGYERSKSPDDGHELSKDDRLATMPFIEIMRPDQVFFVEKQGIFLLEDSRAGRLSYVVAGGITEHCCSVEEQSELPDVQVSLGGEKPRGHEQGVAGKKKAGEKSGFRKNDCRQSKISGPFYECR